MYRDGMTTYTERFNTGIRAAMAAHGLMQGDVAALLGLNVNSVGQRLRGQARWQLDEVQALAAFFEVPDGAVFTGPSAWVSGDLDAVAARVDELRKGAVTGQYTQDEAAIGPGGYRLSPGVPGQMALSDAVA